MAALATASLESERELLASLTRRRTALKESFRMTALSQTGSSVNEDSLPPANTMLSETASTLLNDLKIRRARRRGTLTSLEGTSLRQSPEPHSLPDDNVVVGIRRLRALRDKTQRTRFDESSVGGLTSSEHHERRVEVAPSESSMRWRTLASQLGDVTRKEVEQQSYDFFTSSIAGHDEEDVKEEVQEHQRPEGPQEPAEVDNEDQQQEVEEVDRDAPQVSPEQSVQAEGEEEVVAPPSAPPRNVQDTIVCYRLPRYTPYHVRWSRENQIYSTPSRRAVLKDHEEQRVSDIEAGIFVARNPRIGTGNYNVIENRLLARPDKGEHWFGEDGCLKFEPNPLKELITRPLVLAYSGEDYLKHKDPFTTTAHQNYLIATKTTGISGEGHQLELTIGSLQFSHHPLFSVEHVLSVMLEEACCIYHSTDRNRLADHYRQKMQALKYVIQDLSQQLSECAQEGGEGEEQIKAAELNHQLNDYKQELRAVRQSYNQTEAAEYSCVKSVLELWQQLKRVREQQAYSSTNLQLLVHRVTTDAVREEIQWERDIIDEVEELREDFDNANRQAVSEYHEQLAEWKIYEKRRRRAVRQAGRDQDSVHSLTPSAADAASHNSAELETSSTVSIPPERPRPKVPPTFQADIVRQTVVQKYREQRRKPGEPRLVPELLHTHPTSQSCPRDEQQRRDAVARTKLKMKLLYNDKEVCQTSDHYIGADFSVHFTTNFTLSVVEMPRTIKLHLVDTTSLLATAVAEIFIPIPDRDQSSSRAVLESYRFSSQLAHEYNHTAVGSGHSHPELDKMGVLVTSGRVSVRVCWGENNDGQSLCPPGLGGRESRLQSGDAIPSIGMSGIANVHNVKKWMQESHFDHNDPRNYELLELLESIPDSSEDTGYFRLEAIDECARLVSEREFENDRRFALLQMRQQGHPGLKGRGIPLDSSSITESVWKSIQDYSPYSLADLPVSIFGNFYEGHQAERARYLQDVRERVLSRAKSRQLSGLSLEDVVHDDIIPNISALKRTLLELVSPRRPLKPQRTARRRPKPQNVHVSNVNLVVRVVRAVGVPLKDEGGRRGYDRPVSTTQASLYSSLTGGEALGSHLRLEGTGEGNSVSPFVKVTFGKESARTQTSFGPHPHWNEELILPFHPPGDDFSPASLQKISDVVRFDLFNEVVVDLLVDDRQRATDIHQRLEKHWLGSLTIPFSTLHARGRVEGTFQLDQPPLLLGYQPVSDETGDGNTQLQLFLALEPSLSVLPPLREQFDNAENHEMLERISIWLKTLRGKYPQRIYSATALGISGKQTLMSRYILPQNPPHQLCPDNVDTLRKDELLHCMEKLAWYVSLIPSLPDAVLFSGTCDIWATSDQFLKMLGGDEEEHAVLLCNYFLHLKITAFVVLGHGIPEGPTAYVLTTHPVRPEHYLLWNPSTGMYFKTTDHWCPLTSVGCLLSHDNIWGNVQEFDDPSRVSFDINNKKLWAPLFSANAKPLISIQQDVLEYSETKAEQVHELQSRLERLLHEHIINMRTRHITRWNHHCSRLLQESLPQFEERLSANKELLVQHQQEFSRHFPQHNLRGFPIHVRCWDTHQLLQEVDYTGLPYCEHERAEFALAVLLYPYPSDVISAWLYLVVMTPIN